MNPEDIDFPVSETYAAGLAQLHGWPVPMRCESLREARGREYHEAYIRKPDTAGQAIRNINMELKDIREELREVRNLIYKKKPNTKVLYE